MHVTTIEHQGQSSDIGKSQIDALYECCNLFYQRNGDEASTVSCPKANLLRYVSPVFLYSDHEDEI
jgi:hypothetical protein